MIDKYSYRMSGAAARTGRVKKRSIKINKYI